MRKMIEGQKGITLISLVITMIIIFILVGATLAIAVGDGGLIDAVKESRKDQQTEILKVKLGIIAQNWSTQKVLNDNITLDDLFNDLIEAGIIKNKEEGIIGPDENGNYEIVTPDGLIFDLIINEDGSITIEEQTNGPRILSVAVEKTSTSITVKPVVKNLEDGTYTYSYKKSTEANYTTDSANTNTKATSCTYTGLTEGALYNIKIQVQNAKGQDEYIVNVKLGGLASGTISVTKTTWANEKATIELATTEQGVIIQYQLGTLTDEWNDYVAPITNLNHGDTIYVRIYNGTVGSTGEGTITVTDSNPPQAANIVFSKTTADVGETITATVTFKDNESGINGTSCKWVYNKIDTKYDEENSIWAAASSFADTTPLQLAAAEEGTYYLHVLSVDKGGNKKASISEGVVVETIEEAELKPNESSSATASTSFSTSYGKIDVIWLKDTSKTEVSQVPNEPTLTSSDGKNLTPVTWTKDLTTKKWTEDSSPQSTWYNYKAKSGTEDNLESMWANAKNTDGSYFVWIPRYAYRITYYDVDPKLEENAYAKPTGYYDGYGMWKAEDGAKKYNLEAGIETIEYKGKKYIIHPAFGTNLDLGGWGTQLKGFWIAKYEMSMETNKKHTNIADKTAGNKFTNSTITAVSKPGVSSWICINAANSYRNSYYYDRTKDSHLIKMSEWGAVAYLTHSQYGRNGYEIDINNSETYITGNGGGSSSAATVTGVANAYDTEKGARASTTGNIYGVYDLSGNSFEMIAMFNADYSGDYYTTSTDTNYKPVSGTHFAASSNGKSTRYATAYNNNLTTYNGTRIYIIGKTGDATKEVYTGKTENSWNVSFNEDRTNLWSKNHPLVIRGGYHGSLTHAGIFYENSQDGYPSTGKTFRVILCF